MDDIVHTLRWAGIAPDEGPGGEGAFGPYIQVVCFQANASRSACSTTREYLSISRRSFATYNKQGNKAYRCFCTLEELQERRRRAVLEHNAFYYNWHCLTLSETKISEKLRQGVPYVIRFKMPKTEIKLSDINYGEITFSGVSVKEDFVIMKADGFPTYHLASVTDDHLMRITHVMRGEVRN